MTATVPPPAPPRTVHLEHCMGTVFTIDVRDTGSWSGPIGEVVAWLHHVDEVFSTYRIDSAISRINRGELRLEHADPDVVSVLELCTEVQRETLGYFTALPLGKIDPTGLVKGWAIERASRLLRRSGSANHAVNGGGDMQLAGESAPGRPWRVGIADPTDRSRVATVVTGRDFAVATSGTAERGLHIVNPFTSAAAAAAYRSATVVGPSLARADAYATAAFVMGARAPGWADTVKGYEALLIAADGTAVASSDWPRFT